MDFDDNGLVHALVIDDDPDMRSLLSRILLREGCQVVAAESAERGLEQLPFYKFHVAFLDHMLPGMEGLVLGEYLRSNNPDMHIALVTGESDERVARLCRSHGLELIEKPFEIRQIIDVVARCRKRTHERRQRHEREAAPDFAPPLGRHVDSLPGYFRMPAMPRRIQDLLAQRIREALANLRLAGGASEQHRVAVLAGLLTAQVLGIRLSKNKDGQTLFEEYDQLMEAGGCRLEFEGLRSEEEG